MGARTKGRLSSKVIIGVLSERWRLCADDSQWILEHFVAPKWRQASFIASNKAVLMRVIREKGIDLLPEAEMILDCLPDRFSDWRSQQIGHLEKLEKNDRAAFPQTGTEAMKKAADRR